MFFQRFSKHIQTSEIISPQDNICVALSGGADSVCLLYLLKKLQPLLNLRVSALHVNHKTRANENDKDEQFCIGLCKDWEIPLQVESLEESHAGASEETLRDKRYSIFENHISANPGMKIATAHNLDDQLETYLMRLFHGSGPQGLAGIPEQRNRFIRPLLPFKRTDIEDYLHTEKINFRIDTSNLLGSNMRSRMRREVVPALASVFGEAFLDAFATGHGRFLAFLNDYKSGLDKIFDTYIQKDDDVVLLNLHQYVAENPLRRHLLLEYCVFKYLRLNCPFSEKMFEEFDNFAKTAQSGRHWQFATEARIIKDREYLRFILSNPSEETPKELFPGQVVSFGNFELSLHRYSVDAFNPTQDTNSELICGDSIKLPLIVRQWQKGDAFYPLGMDKRQKVSDFFINTKVSVDLKKKVPIVFNGNDIVWIAGHRLDNRYKWNKSCNKVFKITIKKENRYVPK